MLDSFGRKIDYMRISVTDRCNFRCSYCLPPQGASWMAPEEILEYREILEIVRAAIRLGIRHFRVTGGEPFVRPGIMGFLEELSALPGAESVSVTTNGSRLEARLEELKRMGIRGINVSLDTLDGERFLRLTGQDELKRVLSAIRRAARLGFDRLKINCVPMREVNRGELAELAALAREYPLDVRFIELMPVGCGLEGQRIPQEETIRILEERYGPIKWEDEEEPGQAPCRKRRGQGPAVYGHLEGFLGDVGFISAMSHEFCSTCSRIRLLADGGLKPCLNAPCGANLRDLLRAGASGEELEQALAAVIWKKPARHGFEQNRPGGAKEGTRKEKGRSAGREFMASIGG